MKRKSDKYSNIDRQYSNRDRQIVQQPLADGAWRVPARERDRGE